MSHLVNVKCVSAESGNSPKLNTFGQRETEYPEEAEEDEDVDCKLCGVDSKGGARGGGKGDKNCFTCEKPDHIARDCPDRKARAKEKVRQPP